MTAHFLSLADLGKAGIDAVLARAAVYKKLRGSAEQPRPLVGRAVVLLLEKPSTRTRLSFEVGVQEMGGQLIAVMAQDLQLGRGEPLEDTARMLSRYAHAVVYRTTKHSRLETLAEHCSIPVINGLSDLYHPCQLLADLQTIQQNFDRPLQDLRVVWVGDGNNMAHSWIEAAALLGFELTVACPDGHGPAPQVLQDARKLGGGREARVTADLDAALLGADVVTTDVWTSMGREAETEFRRDAFRAYTVDAACMAKANPGAIFLHCLPAQRGEEVSAEVIDGPSSRVWDEAENRLHAQNALLERLLPR